MAYRVQGVYCHEHRNPAGYPLLSSKYEYNVRDIFVEAKLTETYQASTNTEREVSYIFEIPPESSVVEFTAQVGDNQVKAIVDEKGEADKKYKAATGAGIEAWKLDKVNDEVFEITLGCVKPNSKIIISILYVYVISSDTIGDSIRLTIPAGLASRPGTAPARETIIPTTPTGQNAITITVGIQALDTDQILGLNSPSHHADITTGFSDDSFKKMSPSDQEKAWKKWKAYVELTSDKFLNDHFVLVWRVPRVDGARCLLEQLSPAIQGKPETFACALTLVSGIELEPEEHEYIFLVDRSGSMGGSRTTTANSVLKTMLNLLPGFKRSTFNIYNFTTSAKSILDGGKSVPYDKDSVTNALNRLSTSSYGGTDINNAVTTVLKERDASKPRCSVIVVTDGLDWGVTAAMQTVQKNVVDAAARSTLLRVFVMGLGDDVSRGMCEALARAGSGATAYISESLLQDHDHLIEKSKIMAKTIGRAPIRIRSISWGMSLNSTQSQGNNDDEALGPQAKGDNLAPPKATQQAPPSGTMFWAIRSSWFAIINGTPRDTKVTVVYEVPGGGSGSQTLEVQRKRKAPGKLIHCLAARALIQTLEDKLVNTSSADEKYWTEAEIVRLGKTYSLASTQTSFIATMNGVGTKTNVRANASTQNRSLLAGVPMDNTSSLGFVSTVTPSQASTAQSFESFASMPTHLATPRMKFAQSPSTLTAAPTHEIDAGDSALPDKDDFSCVLAAQEVDGSFNSSTVEQIVFPDTGIPEIAAFISALDGRDHIKNQIWHAICVIAFLRKKHGGRSSDWSTASSKAEKFAKTNLCCIFDLQSGQVETIFAKSLDDAERYFF